MAGELKRVRVIEVGGAAIVGMLMGSWGPTSFTWSRPARVTTGVMFSDRAWPDGQNPMM
jgi:hypothetical protein